MDILKISLDEYADIPFLKKLLSQLKGVKNFEIVKDEEKTYSWEEIESSEDFKKVMEKSDDDYKNGRYYEMTDDLLNDIFKKK